MTTLNKFLAERTSFYIHMTEEEVQDLVENASELDESDYNHMTYLLKRIKTFNKLKVRIDEGNMPCLNDKDLINAFLEVCGESLHLDV